MRPFPEFDQPPVVEVALSILFDDLPGFRISHVGLLWEQFFRRAFPVTEDHGPIEPVVEQPDLRVRGAVVPKLELVAGAPRFRTWFRNDAGTELIQLQRDRFSRNWRKAEDADVYPRYARIRTTLVEELRALYFFAEENRLGELVPRQCEVTYVNHIRVPHGEVANVLANWGHVPRAFLPQADDVRLQLRYSIPTEDKSFGGRLHVSLAPAWRRKSDEPILVLTLTARGAPQGSGIDGALAFLDVGHEWIVRGFADLTTESMHRAWGRTR